MSGKKRKKPAADAQIDKKQKDVDQGSPANDEIANIRRSQRSAKGQGGHIEQLTMIGEKVTAKSRPSKKTFEATGPGTEVPISTNPLAPEVIKRPRRNGGKVYIILLMIFVRQDDL